MLDHGLYHVNGNIGLELSIVSRILDLLQRIYHKFPTSHLGRFLEEIDYTALLPLHVCVFPCHHSGILGHAF